MGNDDDLPRTLPDDVVQEEVLRRLPPVALAVCRCVCKARRQAIDSCSMLSDLLPLGIFINVDNAWEPVPPILFAPPSMGRKVAADLRSLVKVDDQQSNMFPLIADCCNGLLLAGDFLVNLATRRWAALPPCPAPEEDDYDVYHLVFDPCVSRHHLVVVFRELYDYSCSVDAVETRQDGSAEWPPSPYMMWVYSSETRCWELMMFSREGDPAITLAEARATEFLPDYHRAVYYHGALYAKCKGDFIMRIVLSECKYLVIKLPEDVCASQRRYLQLVKSKCGVYVAIICEEPYPHLRIWLLTESSGRAEWMLKYNINLQAINAQFPPNREYPIERPWTIHGKVCSNRHAGEEDEFEWDFDKNNILKIEVKDEKYHHELITLLGFHPDKEVAFLELYHNRRVLAYNLDDSKVQDLGPFEKPYSGLYAEPTAYFC